MLRIAVVGDLSLQDPARLENVMIRAAEDCDILVQVGDMHPGYDVVKQHAVKKPNNVLAVPGNHDTEWDATLGWPRQWNRDEPECHLAGIDNSNDSFCDKDWLTVETALAALEKGKPVILFVHKPLSDIVLGDGSESIHNMGEVHGGNADSKKLQGMVNGRDVLLVHGHYHAWSLMKPPYADCLIEGRGGAAPELGYTVINVRAEGIVLHAVTLKP
jgi:predicted phosphodiesterase